MDSAREHKFAFNEAISLLVPCDTQEQIDYFWAKLSADPKSEQCGWLKDKFGLSWQIVPTVLGELLSDPDPAKAEQYARWRRMRSDWCSHDPKCIPLPSGQR